MIVDFRNIETGTKISSDLCIIGGGAAGITLARALIGTWLQVSLLESGGLEPDENIQSLYQGESVGLAGEWDPPEPGSWSCRLRYFGGSTNHWGGWCNPLSEMDFLARPWVPHSGWPFTRSELHSYYESAQSICGLGQHGYDVQELADETRHFPNFHPDKCLVHFWQVSSPPTRFGEQYYDELARAENVRVYLHANVVSLETNETASKVKKANIETIEGKVGVAQAKFFTLACGGIENARILLLSNALESKGLGNSSDLVGRFFMQHPHVEEVASVLATDFEYLGYTFHGYEINGFEVQPGISITTAAQKRERILNSSVSLESGWDPNSGYNSLRKIANELKEGRWPDDFDSKLWSVLTDLDSVAEGVSYGGLKKPYRGISYIGATVRSEQMPNPNSKITLGDDRAQLGLRNVIVDWRLTDLDRKTSVETIKLVGEELGRLGLGRVKINDSYRDMEWEKLVWGGCHHMGTTRMSENAQEGVVDPDCRVHTVNNLYVAGSSVFPTSGFANPTLTIVALTLRLADHLQKMIDPMSPIKRRF